VCCEKLSERGRRNNELWLQIDAREVDLQHMTDTVDARNKREKKKLGSTKMKFLL
jgi:hypothetical protein